MSGGSERLTARQRAEAACPVPGNGHSAIGLAFVHSCRGCDRIERAILDAEEAVRDSLTGDVEGMRQTVEEMHAVDDDIARVILDAEKAARQATLQEILGVLERKASCLVEAVRDLLHEDSARIQAPDKHCDHGAGICLSHQGKSCEWGTTP